MKSNKQQTLVIEQRIAYCLYIK